MPDKPSSEQLAWAAGLFEGEGCMHLHGRVGKREVHKSLKEYCPNGHPYSGDNLLAEPITRRAANGELRNYTARRCKTCRRKQERERKAKARERK